MRLTSTAFTDGGEIPAKYTCDGADVSPPLAWTDPPHGTASFALIVDDPDAPDPDAPRMTWVHWVVAALPATATEIAEGQRPAAHVGVNGWNRTSWGGPCPPVGRHRYFFKLYALDRALDLARPTKDELVRAMRGHVLAEATLVGTYARRK